MSETNFRKLLVRTIELYKDRRQIDKELEENKEAIRQHSAGEKNAFSIPGLGKVLVAAKRTKGLDVDIENLNNLNRKQLDWLIRNDVIKLSLNNPVFKSLDGKTKKGILDTGCIKQIEYADGQFRQTVSIRVEKDKADRDTSNLHDFNLQDARPVTSYQKSDSENYDDIEDEVDEEYDEEEADLIMRDLADDSEEFARSKEDGWPYGDE